MATNIETHDIGTAIAKIRKSARPIIVKAGDEKFNRAVLEHGNFDILLLSLHGSRKDSPKALDTGVNHVLAKIAAKKGISFCLDLEPLLKLPQQEKALTLARLASLIVTCRKAHVGLKLLNVSDKHAAQSLLRSLGASSQQAAEALDF